MPITHLFEASKIQQMKQFYQDQIVSKTIPYVLFQAKVEGCTITAYTSRKVVFAGVKEEYEASIWFKQVVNKQLKVDPTKPHMGSDEVGTGDFFGPLVVGATYVSLDAINVLKTAGVMDSKKIKDDKIPGLAKLVKEHCLYSISVMTNYQYNQMIEAGHNQGAIKAFLHNDALTKLLSQMTHKVPIIMDQFVHEKKYYEYLKKEDHVVQSITFLTKAEDQYLAVACGSIIARDMFLNAMDTISEKVDMEIPKGAGKNVDLFGVKMFHQHGEAIFRKVAKLHFANMTRIKEMSLDD